jgi:hypothetical protein
LNIVGSSSVSSGYWFCNNVLGFGNFIECIVVDLSSVGQAQCVGVNFLGGVASFNLIKLM